MLTADQIDALRDRAGEIADPILRYLLEDISRRVAEAGQLTSTASYQVWRAQQLGLSQKEIKKRLQELLNTSGAEIEKLMTQSAEVGYSFDLKHLPTAAAIPFEENAAMQKLVSAAVKLAQEDFTNLTQTLGMVDPYGHAQPLRDAYRQCMDYAFEQVFTGATDYNTAIRQATKNLADMGVRVIDYESGVNTSLEAAVRRNIMGGLGLMQEQISQQNHDEMGADGWEISAHSASAPDHEPIQGKQYDDEEFKRLNGSLKRRIGTLNCGHAVFPIILGVSEPQYTPAELEAMRQQNAKGVTIEGRHYSLYEATQMQRKLERSIRKQKKRILVDKATGDEEKLQIDQTKLRMQNANYKKFSDAAGLRTQRERTFVAGVGRKEAEEAAKAKAKPKEQFYRPVNRGEPSSFQIRPNENISVRKVDSYENVYVSDKAQIKPRALHEINRNTNEAMKNWEIDPKHKPKVVVVSPDEFPALGKYDPVENVVYYTPRITDADVMKDNGGLGFVEYHEMWHMKQAENFREAGWTITQENRGRYIEELCKRAKKNIDKAGITAYNVRDISKYAKINYDTERYDEVEAEYMATTKGK